MELYRQADGGNTEYMSRRSPGYYLRIFRCELQSVDVFCPKELHITVCKATIFSCIDKM